jgi:hypothetical protein
MEVTMVPIASLWLPILVSAVLVFLISSIIHMLLPYHRSDYGHVPGEDAVMDALRRFSIPPGDYLMPAPGGPDAMRSPEFLAKREKGPIMMMTVLRPGPPTMGKQLALWFLYSLLVSLFGGYVAGISLGPDASYLAVFRIVGTVTFAAYALGLWQNSIWFGKAWSITLKSTFDGLIYALVTGGSFGWLWPR